MNAIVRFYSYEVETPNAPSDPVGPLEAANRWAAVRAILSQVPPAEAASVRLTLSTARRCENIKTLILELASRDMRAEDAAAMLNVSASRARDYIIELCDAGVIAASYQLDGTPKICRPYYRLSSDLERMRAFVADLAQLRRLVVQPGRTNCEPVQRDPLVAALFGSQASLVR